MDGSVAGRIEAVKRRIESACDKAGRDPASVLLLAVTKGVYPDRIEEAAAAGLRCFGESKVQEARQKIPMCSGSLEWHMIGHLQSNKARDAARMFSTVHSVDSRGILDAVSRSCAQAGRTLRIFVEVNLAGEGSKFGLPPGDVAGLVAAAAGLPRIEVAGLMTIPPATEDPQDARPFFRQLRELRDRVSAETGVALPGLSMGMSHDFEVAIGEGATVVRIGTGIFGPRERRMQDGGLE